MKLGHAILTSIIGVALPSFGGVIDFENLPAGLHEYPSPNPSPQTIASDGTTFTGGVLLTATYNAPADQSTIYITASFGTMASQLNIINPNGFNNFSFDLINGEFKSRSYLVFDNAGHSEEFDDIPSNADSGMARVSFATTGTDITIEDLGTDNNWCFAIDNLSYDDPDPPGYVADSASTAWLMIGGVLGLAVFARRHAMA